MGRMKRSAFGISLSLLIVWCSSGYADNPRAKINYQLNCQGCHTPDGSGHSGRNIPTLTNFIGKFLSVEGGREFLIQVPGAAQSPLNHQELAELTNWMIREFDPASAAQGFVPYNAEEVKALRKTKVLDFSGVRKALVERISVSEQKSQPSTSLN